MPYGALAKSTAQAAPILTVGAPLTSTGYTLASMRAELVPQLANRSDVTSTRIDGWINDAYVDVCSAIDLPELKSTYSFTLIPNQPLYIIPPQLYATTGISVVDDVTYSFDGGRPLSKSTLDNYRRKPTLIEEVQEYFLHEGMIVFWPTPKSARLVAVDFMVRPLLLTADTNSPFLAREWHEVILKAARAKAFDALLEFELAQTAEGTWMRMVQRKKDPKAEEDTGRLIGSSVPRTRAELFRNRRGYPGGLDGI